MMATGLFVLLASLNLQTAMWFDESFSAYLIRGDFAEIWRMTAMDVHPPLYYFCLKVWSMIFGTSEFALRFMSVMMAGVAMFFAYFLIKRWFGKKTASVGTLLLSISPLLIRYSQEMRMYALAFLIVIWATLMLDIALKSRKKVAWVGYAVLVALGMWTHYFTALVWIAELVYIIRYLRRVEGKKYDRNVLWVYPLAMGLFLPWVPSFLSQVMTVQAGFWISEITLVTPISFLSEALVYREAEAVTGWLIIMIISIVIFAVWLLRKGVKKMRTEERENVLLLSLLVFLPPVLLMILSLPPLSPTYVTRYVVYSASLLWVLIGVIMMFGGEAEKKPVVATVLAIFMVGAAAIGDFKVNTRENAGEMREVISAISEEAEVGEPILLQVSPTHYYDAFFYETTENRVYAAEPKIIWASLEPIREYKENYIADTEEFIAGAGRFWYVLEEGEENNMDEIFETAGFEKVRKFEVSSCEVGEFVKMEM